MRKFAATAPNREEFYKNTAEAVIFECIRIWPGEPAFRDLFDHFRDDPEKAWYYSARIGSLANPLFKLRGIEGFSELCRSVAVQSNPKDAACELYAIGLFFDAGFSIRVKPQANKNGSVFDFQATKNDSVINVEVSNMTAAAHSPTYVAKKLKDEKRQLPDDGSNVLFVFAPESWYEANPEVDALLAEDAAAFLRRTGRINAVIFMNERHETFGGDPLMTGRLGFEFSVMKTNAARKPSAELQVFLDGSLHWLNRVTSEQELAMRMTQRQNTGLYDWADKFWNERRND